MDRLDELATAATAAALAFVQEGKRKADDAFSSSTDDAMDCDAPPPPPTKKARTIQEIVGELKARRPTFFEPYPDQ